MALRPSGGMPAPFVGPSSIHPGYLGVRASALFATLLSFSLSVIAIGIVDVMAMCVSLRFSRPS